MDRWLPDNKNKKILLAILFSLGLIFLVISEYDFTRTEEETNSIFQEEEYVQKLENRLAAIIEKMDGISNVNVMITLKRGEGYQYTKEVGNTSDQNNVFRFDNSGNGETPVLIATDSPIVKGVCVVCRGAKDAVTQNKITSLVASTLNLKQNQIYVTT